jgi:PAS domain S-box-containing protein
LPTNKENPEKVPRDQTIAKRKKAEEVLRDSELRFRSVYENSFDAILLTKPDGQILTANPAAQRMFGMSENEIQKAGRNSIVVIDERAEPALKERARTGKAKAEFTFRRKDGTTFEGEAASSVFTDSDGIVKTSMIIRDITERKKAEEALKASEERFRTVQENSLDRFTILKPFFNDQGEIVDFIFVYQNSRAAKLTGRKPEQLVGLRMTEVYPTFPQTRFFSLYKRAFETRQVIEFEDHYQADKVDDWFLVVVTPISDGIAITTQIITTRKKVEEALKQSEEKYRNIVETTQEGILVTDLEGKITFANKRIADSLGYTVEELVGKPGLDLAVESEKPSAQERMEKRREGIKEQYEIWMRRKDGDKVCFLASGSPILNPQGQHTGNLGMYVDITERKKAEEELRKSEARLRLIAQAGRIGFFEYNASKDIAYWSPEHYELLGYESGSVISWQRWLQGVNPDDKERIIANATQLMKRARSEGHIEGHKDEYRYIRPDGSIVWIESDLSLSMVNNEAIIRGSIRDITKRKKAEEALKQSQELISNQLEEIKSYYDNAPVGLAILDRELRYIRVNNRFAEMDGMPAEEHVGKTVREVVPTLAEQAEELPRKIIKSGEAVRNIEFIGETVACPGEKRTWLESWIPIKDSSGQVTALYVMAVDITERKKAEERLEEYGKNLEKLVEERTEQLELTSAYARNLLEASLDPLVTINKEGKITDVNKATEDVTGCVRGEMLGSDFSNYFTEPDQARAGYKKAFTEGIVKDYPLAIKHTCGKITLVLFNATVYTNGSGEIQGVFAAARDITELKKAEAEAQEAAKKLKDSERLAAIGATAGMVGHDIRNPLQAISSDVYLLKSELDSMPEGEAKENVAESLQGIEQNVDYINKIVQDLQDYARPLNPKIEESDLKSIIDTFIAKNGLPKNIKLNVKIKDDARMIRVDPYYLNRILFNLVTNAVQAMPNGGKLTIMAHIEAGDTILAVKDTGVGIPKEISDKMFTLMFTTKSKGQGFGLPVVKRMTESLGGTVTFESQEGKGTTFIVRLPPPKELNGKWIYK